MDLISIIKEVGRGASGARSLSVDAATDLFAAILEDAVPPLQLGALLIALRMKGESSDEMEGFLRAATRCRPVLPLRSAEALRPIVIPSYNGARRGANLTPLVAALLARLGLTVLVHGPKVVSDRVGTIELMIACGITKAADWVIKGNPPPADTGVPFWIDTPALFPQLDRIMALRKQLGLRNAAHSLIKLIDPFGGQAVVLHAATHPAYLELAAALFARVGGRALIFRATEGEPYFNPKRTPSVVLASGGTCASLIGSDKDSLTDLPDLPADASVEATVVWHRDVLAGLRPIPAPILEQLACCWMASGGADDLSSARLMVADRLQ